MKKFTELVKDVNERKFDYYVGVPDSLLSGLFEEFHIQIATNEFIAYCMAIGAQLAGRNPSVYIQNSGFFYTIPAINGICYHYKVFPFLYITKPHGHSHIGNNETVERILETVIDPQYYVTLSDTKSEPVDFPEVITPVCDPALITSVGSTRKATYADLIAEIRAFDEALIVSSAGYQNGLVEEQLGDKFPVCYLRGGMGGSIPVGIGLAQSTDKDIVVITGDGAVLMHYTALSTVKDLALENLHIYIVINGVLESTGGQVNPSLPIVDMPNVHYIVVNEEIPVRVKKGMTVYDYDALKKDILDYVSG